jgi:ABC-type dipeptide/oligopeptide/nickel transport system permease subunit
MDRESRPRAAERGPGGQKGHFRNSSLPSRRQRWALAAPRPGSWVPTSSGATCWRAWSKGARLSVSIGALAVALALVVGVPIRALSGYAGGTIDNALMRRMDALQAFPALLLALGLEDRHAGS